MSTDTRPPHTPTPRDAGDEGPAKPKLELSLTQVLGGALAAMTAAFLGSRLSVAGTVVGAAVASVVAAVAGSVYTASLRSTQYRVRTVLQSRVAGSTVPTTVEAVEDRDLTTSVEAPGQPSAPGGSVDPGPARRRWSWQNVVVAAVAAFVLAGLALTGLELATGSALSGGDGTTIGRVAEPRRPVAPQSDDSPSAEPSASASSAAPSAPPEAAETASAEPESTPAAPPEPEEEPSADPSASDPTPAPPAPEASDAPTSTPAPSASSPAADEG